LGILLIRRIVRLRITGVGLRVIPWLLLVALRGLLTVRLITLGWNRSLIRLIITLTRLVVLWWWDWTGSVVVPFSRGFARRTVEGLKASNWSLGSC